MTIVKDELKVKRGEGRDVATFVSYPAVPITQNNQRFYFTTIPKEDIFPFCFVVRRNEDPVQGFQRMLSEERAQDIAQYLDNSKGSIPTNIVLSAQEGAGLSYDGKKKTVRYCKVPQAFLILDGQHRMYGYSKTKKSHRVPVAIYEGLTRQEEAALFIDINTNQRGVPAALLLDIKQVAERENEVEKRLREIFDRLSTDPESPFNGLLSPASSAKGKISRVSFNRGMRNVIDNVVMLRLGADKQFELLRNYFSAVEKTVNNWGLLTRAAYFEAFCEVFADVLDLVRQKHDNYKLPSLIDVLAPVANVDLELVSVRPGSNTTKGIITPVIKQALHAQVDVDESMI